MLTSIRQWVAPPVFEGDEERTRITRLLNGVLWAMLALSAVGAPPLIVFSETASGRIVSIVTVGTIVLAALGLLWLMRRGRPRLASALLLSVLLIVFSSGTLFFGGIRNTIAAGYLLVIVIASLLLGGRGTLIFSLATLLTILGLFWAERTYEGVPILPLGPQANMGDLITFFGIVAMMAVFMGFALHDVTEALERAQRGERELAASNRELRASRDTLQATMFDLERRNKQIRLASEVARDASAAQDLEHMLEQAVHLIKTRFGVYHAGLFLVDERGEYAVLRAASGRSAEQALERGFRLRVGGRDAVGQVTTTGSPYLVRDTEKDPTYVEHPLLAETRSEAMLPLRVGEEIIGAISLQSREVNAFDEDDVAVLQTMADQLAVAIENARLLTEMEQTVRELEAASGRYTRESWRAMGRGREARGRATGYRYRRLGVEPAHEYPAEASTRAAWQEGRPVVITQPDGGGDGHGDANAAAIPIKLRDQVIGMFKLSSKDGTLSPQALSLVEETAERLALAMENARLLEETRRRVAREQLTREITDKMRQAAGVERIVQTAVDELYDALGTSRAFVRLGPPSSPEDDSTTEST